MLWMDFPCPRYDMEWKHTVETTDEYQRLEKQHSELITFIREKTGAPLPRGLNDIWSIYDPIFCEVLLLMTSSNSGIYFFLCPFFKVSNNDTHSVPDWVTPAILDKILVAYADSVKYYYYDVKLLRIRGG